MTTRAEQMADDILAGVDETPGVPENVSLAKYISAALSAERRDALVECAKIVRHHMSFNSGDPYHVHPMAYDEICELAGIEKHHPLYDSARALADQEATK